MRVCNRFQEVCTSPGSCGYSARSGAVFMEVADNIVCVDCGGRCHRLTPEPDGGFAHGTVVAYRCEECLDRWDLVVEYDGSDERESERA